MTPRSDGLEGCIAFITGDADAADVRPWLEYRPCTVFRKPFRAETGAPRSRIAFIRACCAAQAVWERRAQDSNLYGVAPSGFQDRRLTS
jgi:hypothetical protein